MLASHRRCGTNEKQPKILLLRVRMTVLEGFEAIGLARSREFLRRHRSGAKAHIHLGAGYGPRPTTWVPRAVPLLQNIGFVEFQQAVKSRPETELFGIGELWLRVRMTVLEGFEAIGLARSREFLRRHRSGAKAHIHLGAVTARDPLRGFPEPCPCYKQWVRRVSASCEARALVGRFRLSRFR